MMRRLLIVLLLMAWPAAAQAELGDYDPESSEWTGLREMIDVASAHGIEIEPVEVLDYDALDPSRPVIVIYPQQPLDVPSLSRYIVDGGRMLLADDFGASEGLLDRLEIARVVPSIDNLPHETFAANNPAFPILVPNGKHPLIEGVERVVANHPSVITNVGGPVIAYDAGPGLVYDMNLGDGKAIVLADASMFINQMLPVADNELLLVNALRYICRDAPDCQPLLVTRDFEQRGSYQESSPFETGTDLAQSIRRMNDYVATIMANLPGEEFLYYLSLLLVAGLAVYLVTVFPLRRTRAYSGYISDFFESIPAPQSEFDWNLSRFGRGTRSMNYALPLSILKENFEELFLTKLGYWPSRSGERPPVEEIADRFAEEFGEGGEAARLERRREALDILSFFAQIPPRNRVFLDADTHFTEADLLRYYRKAMAIIQLMGLKDEYQRRTRGGR